MAECLGVCMAASIAPQVKFPAILAQRNVAAVAIDNSVIFAADLAEHLLFNNDHFGRLLYNIFTRTDNEYELEMSLSFRNGLAIS
jgi:hypothetical protein